VEESVSNLQGLNSWFEEFQKVRLKEEYRRSTQGEKCNGKVINLRTNPSHSKEDSEETPRGRKVKERGLEVRHCPGSALIVKRGIKNKPWLGLSRIFVEIRNGKTSRKGKNAEKSEEIRATREGRWQAT